MLGLEIKTTDVFMIAVFCANHGWVFGGHKLIGWFEILH